MTTEVGNLDNSLYSHIIGCNYLSFGEPAVVIPNLTQPGLYGGQALRLIQALQPLTTSDPVKYRHLMIDKEN